MKIIFILLITAFFSLTCTANANSIKIDETTAGRQIYSVSDVKPAALCDPSAQYQLKSVFNAVYEKTGRLTSKNYMLQYTPDNNALIEFYPDVKFFVGQQYWQLTATSTTDLSQDGSRQLSWSLPASLLKALLAVETPVVVRLFYKTAKGDQYKDFILNKGFLSSVKKMYSRPSHPVMFVAF